MIGDFNHNGTLDAADFVVWRKGLGTSYTQYAYNIWRSHFGQTAGSGAGVSANAAVPEPATLVPMMFATADWCLRLRRKAQKVPSSRLCVTHVINPPIKKRPAVGVPAGPGELN